MLVGFQLWRFDILARPVNKKAMLKKQCKEHESNIKKSLKLQGINYNTKAFEVDVKVPKIDAKTFKVDDQNDGFKIRIYIVDYVYNAISDVKNNAFEFIDDEFCELHSLPNLERFHDELSDAQAIFISLIVNELYPDMDSILDKRPNTAMLLLPALAHDKLNKARIAIDKESFEIAELLIEEVRSIAEMIVIVHRYFNPAPYKALSEEKQQHKKSVSDMRSELVKKTAKYGFSLELRALVVDYAEDVKLLLEHHNMLGKLTDITIFSVKGLDLHTFDDDNKFYDSLSNLAYEFEEKYETLYKQRKMEKDDNLEDVFISLATIRRHLVDIVS